MNQPGLLALVDRLQGLPRETEWLEFKHNNADAQEIGEYLSALANEAALLLRKLPERLSEKQKRTKVHNLLQELRRAGRIEQQGPPAGAQ